MNGDLANWIMPGLFTPGVGGAMELAQKARRVVIMMNHCDKKGRSKIVRECSLPLTAPACVDRIYTELAVIDIVSAGLVLREIATDTTLDEVLAATAAPLQVPEHELPTF
jgi:3-oxoacid CoA-transferase B subunit